MPTLVIAEAGSNHNQNIEIAYHLIDAAADAGCQIVKFQLFTAENLLATATVGSTVRQAVELAEMPRSWLPRLMDYCEEKGIEFLATPFDEEAVDLLVEHEVKRIKIAGFESTDPRFVKLVASTKLPIIISIGIGQIHNSSYKTESVQWIREVNPDADISVLHCNNAYPTPYNEVGLAAMALLGEETGLPIGLSDHTEGIVVPPIAVGWGAEIIEKHFTLDRNLPGPDHHYAIEPDELKEMIRNIRIAEQVTYRRRENCLTMSERNFACGMRSVVSLRDIRAGEILSEINITTKRPYNENAIHARYYFNIIGKVASKFIPANSVVRKEQVQL